MDNAHAILEAIGQLPDDEIDLADAALQLARVEEPLADWRAARDHLSLIARECVELARDIAGADMPARAAALAGLLAGRHGYRGDSETYDSLDNANLIRVIERRKGLPVSLGILWLHAAHAAGWMAHGLDFPGHFVIALDGQPRLVLDVFAGGQPLDARTLRAMIKRVDGPRAELTPDLLQPISPRAVLLRLQNNIMTRRLKAGEMEQALACCEDMLRIAPDAATLWHECALIHERLDHVSAAVNCLQQFVALIPKGEASDRARRAMDELRARLN
jgi:regulator of sirC expression with transglutaminase-like and TPR domain